MTVVKEQLVLPGGGTPQPIEVTVFLAGAQGRPIRGITADTSESIIHERVLSIGNGINASGYWELDLEPQSNILPSGTTWGIEHKIGCTVETTFIVVPASGGPYDVFILEDDPLNSIAPSALQGHASDLLLHGGGIQIDYKQIVTAITVTGSGGGLTLAQVTGTQVVLPDLARSVMLHAHVPAIQPSGGPSEQNYGLFNAAGGMGAFGALDAVSPPGLNTTTARHAELWALLPPHSQGNYIIGATGVGGNLTARVNASAIQKCFLRIVTV